MKLKISFQNFGGELDSMIADDEEHAIGVLMNMLEEINELHDGDKFIITEVKS